ncbi:MAG: ribonuclease HI [Acidobacteriota bacterium]
MNTNLLTIYTDGGASPNPGPGGWGAVLLEGSEVRELSGGEERTTNNRMELTAAIRALESLGGEPREVRLITDSQYLRRGVTEWLAGWQARGWRKKTGDEVLNADLWKRLAAVISSHRIEWSWVKGHSGDRWNERADELATEAGRKLRPSPPPPPVAEGEVFLKVSCSRGRGGWAALIRDAAGERVLQGRRQRTTANELEVLAAAEALEAAAGDGSLSVFTGSDYLRLGATRWLAGWRRKGWRTATGKAVQNRAAWERLAAAMKGRKLYWPGAGDDPDAMARLAQALGRAAGGGR